MQPQTDIFEICDSHIHSWIELATKHCLNQLQIHFNGGSLQEYRFPVADFDFGSLLISCV